MKKNNDSRPVDEKLRELIREANGAQKDLKYEISQAREILPGLRSELIEAGIIQRIDDELDRRFEEILDKKIHEMHMLVDKHMEKIAEGTVRHFAAMTILLYRVLDTLQAYPNLSEVNPIDLASAISYIVEKERVPTPDDSPFKFLIVEPLPKRQDD